MSQIFLGVVDNLHKFPVGLRCYTTCKVINLSTNCHQLSSSCFLCLALCECVIDTTERFVNVLILVVTQSNHIIQLHTQTCSLTESIGKARPDIWV